MTRNEILEVANQFYKRGGVSEREIAFARYMMKYEREQCANICDEETNQQAVGGNSWWATTNCAQAIRARDEA